MKARSKVTVRKIKPRMLGGALLVLALTGESYLMSVHNRASAREEPMPQPSTVAIAPETPPLAPPGMPAGFAGTEMTDAQAPGASSPSPSPNPPRKPAGNSTHGTQSHPTQAIPTAAVTNFCPSDDRAAVLRAVASLELESISVSQVHRSCNINGIVCEEAQQIAGFTIETVGNGSVIISRGVYRFELTLRH